MSIENSVVESGSNGKVLIVEDSITFSGILKRSILAKLDVEIVLCRDYASTEECLKQNKGDFFIALLDIVLPDAPNGEVVDLVVENDIPSIVFTGEISDSLRTSMWSKRIVDYVQKVNFDDIHHVVSLVDRLSKNFSKQILVIDESDENCELFGDLLRVYNFEVLKATSGKAALDIIKSTNINLVITGNLPSDMNGPAVVKEIRRGYSKTELPVIGLSSEAGASASAEFLKSGANDYIRHPFVPEEFYCRVTNTIDSVEYIQTIKRISDNDRLTGVYTRRALFKYGEKLYAQQQRTNATLVAVMIDIDNMGSLNAVYGQFVGDQVIAHVAEILKKRFRKGDVVSRFGGDTFCILCADMKLDCVTSIFNEVAQNISSSAIQIGEHQIKATVSIGINAHVNSSLEEMLSCAERVLNEAKEHGVESIKCIGEL